MSAPPPQCNIPPNPAKVAAVMSAGILIMTFDALFSPLRVGELTLPNRILMAPLTRCRAEGERCCAPLLPLTIPLSVSHVRLEVKQPQEVFRGRGGDFFV